MVEPENLCLIGGLEARPMNLPTKEILMRDVDDYSDRLRAMRSRLLRQLDDEAEEIRESIQKPGEQIHLHTHNADMDVEGVDEAVGVSHALEQRLKTVDAMLAKLSHDGAAVLADERQREHLDALLEIEDFAEGEGRNQE